MIKKEFHFINDEDEKCVFHIKEYYDFVCAVILDHFHEELKHNKFHEWFISTLNTLEDYDDVYFITSEMPYYWSMCIIENDRTNKSLQGEELDSYIQFAKKYRLDRGIRTFLEEGLEA